MSESMSAATEAVKQALLSVTQDQGCNPATVALVTQAVNQWETIESDVCGDLRKQLAEAEAENAELRRNVFMPATWKCDICGFEQSTTILNPATGQAGAPLVQEVPVCPNKHGAPLNSGGEPVLMRRVTWEECAGSNYEAAQRFLDERDAAANQHGMICEAHQRAKELLEQQLRAIKANSVEIERLRRCVREAQEHSTAKRIALTVLDEGTRNIIRATGLCEVEGNTLGVVQSLCDLATERVKELRLLETALKRSIVLTFDIIEGCFKVTFGSGQTLLFEKPKNVAGNVENWLANLRHAD